MNDGSTDGTKGFLEEYQKKTKLNFKHFNQRNAGPSAARNLGIKNAEGHTIILIGDDMIMGPKFIENHINFHRVNPQLSHACLGFIDWSKDIEISPFMKLITSKEGGQQFNYDYVEKQDPENIGYTVFWSSNVSFKRLFCVTHGLFNDKVFKHAMWEDIELGYRLEKAGLILHFRKDYKVYHEHKINFERFAERQRMVGWYSHDLSHLGIPSEYSCGGHERDMLYSKDALKDIVKAVKEYELENKKNDLPLMNKIYNSALYYAALVGYKEREEKLKRKVGGIVALLYNLLLKKEQIHSKDAHICTIEATIRDRDTHIGNLNGIINDKGVLISNLETAIRDKDAHIANLDGIIKDKDIQISTLENTRMKIESSLSYKVGNIIVFLLAAIREHLDYIMRIIKDSFLFNKNRISKFPAEFGFRGCLDSPQKNESFTTLTGWFLSHKKIHKVELYICKKKISDISLNKYRPDVKAAWPKYDHHEYNGYEYALPEQVIKKYAGKRSTIFLRFYLDDKQYVDRFKTPVKFPDGSFLPSNWIPLLKYIGDKKVLPPTNQQPQQNTPPIVCKRFALYTSSLGNYFFWEIRDLISAGLEELGFEVDIRDENGGYSGDANWHLVIAPHEFFYLGNGEKMRNQESPHNLVLINSEQPSTQWFSLSRDCFPKAHRIWDIDHNSYKVIAKKGYRCDFLPLGYVPRLELFNEVEKLPDHYGTYSLDASVRERSYFRKPYSSRPIDVMFVGNLTKRREEFFAKSAPVLSQYSSYFHFSDHLRPLLPGKTTFMDTRTVVGLAQRSKILLNIHQGQDVYFEWQRIVMQGIWQKTLVISEPCSSAPPFRPNIDFVEATLGEMSKKINYYLSTKKGLIEARAITEQGFKTLTKKCRLTDALRPLIMQLYVPGSQRVFWASPVRMNIFKRDIK